MERVDDPAAIARAKARDERARRNDEWLRAHRADLLPRARGRHLAVAGEEAFIADTYEEAWAMARAAHPEDDGLLCQAIPADQRLPDNLVTIQLVDDPVVVARNRAQDERFKRNLDWLQAHWDDLLPQARGKFVVVAGQEAFVADTSEEAWAMAEAAHLEDNGTFCHYVTTKRGPRIYAYRW
jgi:hypothetical protein